ncbi:integrase [Klebsiella pneumoniae subsp. pneumoniae KpMDU1]|nr:integrase [Klebsiella pneumoniae subsp. pneumoniae KpMDU1]
MNSIIPLQNSPERVSLLPIAPGVDFATAVALRRMATSTGATPAYLLAPEVSALLWYMPDQRHHMLFATMWNTGIRIGEARTLTPESFDLDGLRPFVRVLSEKVRARRGRPPKDEVRLVPLTDASFVRQMESWMVTTRPRRREPLWPVTDETMRNWLKQAVKRAEADGVHFSIPVTPHTFRHSYIMHMLYHRQPGRSSRHWPGIRIRARWKSIPGYLRWTWLPPWPFPLPVMVEMPRRSFAPCPRPAEIDGPGMTSCIPLIRNTGAESIQPPPCSSTPGHHADD